MTTTPHTVSFLGLGEMGSALARAALQAGHSTIVWNRSAGKASAFAETGARVAADPADAVDADLIVVCLLDHASVHEVLDPVADRLDGRRLINLTTTSPDGSRELATWAAGIGADYLDGGIMATPDMIATPQSSILYSGSEQLYTDFLELLETWGGPEYFGTDAGMASLYDLALLSGMYSMFAGMLHGAAMVGTVGVPAKEFIVRAIDFLHAVLPAATQYGEVIDGGDYSVPGQQSLIFSDLTDFVNASRAAGISSEVVDAVQRLIQRQVDAGYGTDGLARIIESIKNPEVAA
jgi:3-hydroxyisobutyrate dehydrogenase-like beta-hydroxyacid dehydrogenase